MVNIMGRPLLLLVVYMSNVALSRPHFYDIFSFGGFSGISNGRAEPPPPTTKKPTTTAPPTTTLPRTTTTTPAPATTTHKDLLDNLKTDFDESDLKWKELNNHFGSLWDKDEDDWLPFEDDFLFGTNFRSEKSSSSTHSPPSSSSTTTTTTTTTTARPDDMVCTRQVLGNCSMSVSDMIKEDDYTSPCELIQGYRSCISHYGDTCQGFYMNLLKASVEFLVLGYQLDDHCEHLPKSKIPQPTDAKNLKCAQLDTWQCGRHFLHKLKSVQLSTCGALKYYHKCITKKTKGCSYHSGRFLRNGARGLIKVHSALEFCPLEIQNQDG